MRTSMIMLLLCCSTIMFMYAQLPHLEVLGHAKIRGNLDINHMDDTTTIYIGRNAGINTTFPYNRHNTFVGSNVGYNNTSSNNSFFGNNAGYNNTGGNENSFFGSRTGYNNDNGSRNSFFGRKAGLDNTTGDNNSFFGWETGSNNTTGAQNSFFGRNAGFNNETGDNNSFLGYHAGNYLTGSRNISIGYNSGPIRGFGNVSDRLYIDVEETNEPLIYGEFDNGLLIIHHPVAVQGHTRGLRIKNTDSNKNWWTLYTVNAGGELFLYSKAEGSDEVGSFDDASGEYSALSDRRKKKDIQSLESVLSAVLMLQPSSYRYLSEGDDEKAHIGLIAQELQEVFPQFVSHNQESDLYHVNYAGLSVVAIKAIQEQEVKYAKRFKEIEKQTKTLSNRVDQLTTENTQLKIILSNIITRLELLDQKSAQIIP